MENWISGTGPQNEIVLSSRIRLARNIANIPFPSMLDEGRANQVIEGVKSSFEDFKLYRMEDSKSIEKQILVEKHLISPNLAKQSQKGAVAINKDETISIMVNEEDHIRIQCILPGLQIKKSWEYANEIDDELEQKLDYAFDENWGYLTYCPTNVGTGLRASIMIHLPALNMTGNINKIFQAVVQIGLTIRGLYGEGTDFVGNIFQISNQITLGRSEEELIDNLTSVTSQIIEKEKEARRLLLNSSRLKVEDKIWRSYGVMTNARVMQAQECLRLLSDIRLGVDLGILKHIPVSVLNEIMMGTQPANIQNQYEAELSSIERDTIRAEITRKRLAM